MVLVRVVVLALVVALCGGFVPVSGCAKGCGGAGRSAARHTDDFASTGMRYSDDLARPGGRHGYGTAPLYGAPGHVADDLAHVSASTLDDALARLPEPQGAASALAREPSSTGARLHGIDDAQRSFARDYARTVDDLGLSSKQHGHLLDALEVAQDVAEELVGALADDGSSDAKTQAETTAARARFRVAASELDATLRRQLTRDQRAALHGALGTTEVIVYRLGRDKPLRRGSDTP